MAEPFRTGDVVEILAGGMAGNIGIAAVTPGWETIGVDVRCVHIRKPAGELRLLRRPQPEACNG
jgi:hypothetical protein